jgi:hypothetical protein
VNTDDPKVEAARAWLSRFEPGALAKLLHVVGFSEVTFLTEDQVGYYLGRREDELRPLRRVNVGSAIVGTHANGSAG